MSSDTVKLKSKLLTTLVVCHFLSLSELKLVSKKYVAHKED